MRRDRRTRDSAPLSPLLYGCPLRVPWLVGGAAAGDFPGWAEGVSRDSTPFAFQLGGSRGFWLVVCADPRHFPCGRIGALGTARLFVHFQNGCPFRVPWLVGGAAAVGRFPSNCRRVFLIRSLPPLGPSRGSERVDAGRGGHDHHRRHP